jgi:hypothetical protein
MNGFQQFLQDKNIRTEGQESVRGLNTIAKEIGYKDSGFMFGSAFEEFLSDNPGAVQALHEWIEKYYSETFETFETDEEGEDE